eukprot:CAMPEP_0119038526 /NCGR_PEP_ID=MMETSP1177-20130426/7498_1 /TAXON_ID=2985 /ORGANISM="Ochromonas sp, Strain CCMP1899" /LENGTH=471 /DNA_ID=CAMNT_0007001231 /DNA_START=164 /DNA_END=1576 /DNA_ORIENTATION=-
MSRLKTCFHYRNAIVGFAKRRQGYHMGFLQFSSSRNEDEPKLTKSDEIQYHSVNEINVDKTPITAQLWSRRREEGRNSMVMSTDTELNGISSKPQISTPILLMDKTAKESRLTIRYNFSQDANLRDLYVDSFGNVLIGKLFEDLDALAGNVAISHCDDNDPLTKPLSLVTACVDRIRQSKKISAADDLILTGQIVWVGSSSLDVLMEIHRVKDIKGNSCEKGICDFNSEEEGAILIKENVPSRLLSSLFTYVARDRSSGKACAINRYIPTGLLEEDLFNRRKAIAVKRKAEKNKNHDAEFVANAQSVLNSLVERGSAMEDMPALARPNAVLMKYTALENSLLCQPQNVNTAGRVFGGYLMHRAYDLAQATSYIFAGAYPHFLEVDQIDFKKPVDIGDLVRLKSRVVFTNDDPSMSVVMIEVTCQVVRPEKASSFVSNEFNFVFRFDNSVSLRRVLPSTYEEAVILVKASNW